MISPSAEQIRERLAKITPGPWAWESIAEKSNEFAVGTAFNEQGEQLTGLIPEGEWIEDSVIRRECIGMNESGHANFADADFIANAPTDIAYLLTLLDTLSRELERMRKEYQELLTRSGKPDADRDVSIHAPADGKG